MFRFHEVHFLRVDRKVNERFVGLLPLYYIDYYTKTLPLIHYQWDLRTAVGRCRSVRDHSFEHKKSVSTILSFDEAAKVLTLL